MVRDSTLSPPDVEVNSLLETYVHAVVVVASHLSMGDEAAEWPGGGRLRK